MSPRCLKQAVCNLYELVASIVNIFSFLLAVSEWRVPQACGQTPRLDIEGIGVIRV